MATHLESVETETTQSSFWNSGLGFAAIWQQALGGGDPGVFLYPLVSIVAVWAVAALLLLRHYSKA